MTPTLIKNHVAGATVEAYRIVKHGSSDGAVVHGTNGTSAALIGVTGELGAESGERVDVVRAGIAEVTFGGTVSRGAAVTATSTGKAVAATPGGALNNYVIGFAEVDAVDGDIAPIMLAPSIMNGEGAPA